MERYKVQYKKFQIRNFKGIKDTTVDLTAVAGASVFAFVGLNESGKTTILEAIHSFSPDTATNELVGGESTRAINKRVPRHLISIFTGDVSVIATLCTSFDEKKSIIQAIEDETKLIVDVNSLPDEIVFERKQSFRDGDLKGSFFSLLTEPSVREKSKRKFRSPDQDERVAIRDVIYSYTPDISYFPTFVFDFPKTIFLTDRGDELD
jgi:hypothetical protein